MYIGILYQRNHVTKSEPLICSECCRISLFESDKSLKVSFSQIAILLLRAFKKSSVRFCKIFNGINYSGISIFEKNQKSKHKKAAKKIQEIFILIEI